MAKKLPVLSEAKSVLPEVLPDPRRPKAESAPRSRTVAHMQRLLATAAAVGVATVSCGKEKTATDPSGERQGCGKKPGASSGDPNSSSGNSSGYAVVDPMPPPALCPDVAPTVKATATWKKGDAGAWLLDVFFPNPPRADYKYVKDAPPTVYTGTLVSHTVGADGVHVILAIDATAKNASLSVKGTCDKGPGTLTANVSWADGPKVGGVTAVIVSEY